MSQAAPSTIEFDSASPLLSVLATSNDTGARSATTDTTPQDAEPIVSPWKVSERHDNHTDSTALAPEARGDGSSPILDAAPVPQPDDYASAADHSTPSTRTDQTDTDVTEMSSRTPDEDDAASSVVSEDATSLASAESGESESVGADYSDYHIGTSTIADPLKYIAISFEDKCREIEGIKKTREKELAAAAATAALLETMREEKEQLEESLSQSEAARAELEEQLQQLRAEMVSLKDDISHKDQLLATSDKISTSLFGVLMAAKSTLDSAGSLAPAMRTLSSSYAQSASATDDESDLIDSDEDDEDAQTADTDHEGADASTGDATFNADAHKAAASNPHAHPTAAPAAAA